MGHWGRIPLAPPNEGMAGWREAWISSRNAAGAQAPVRAPAACRRDAHLAGYGGRAHATPDPAKPMQLRAGAARHPLFGARLARALRRGGRKCFQDRAWLHSMLPANPVFAPATQGASSWCGALISDPAYQPQMRRREFLRASVAVCSPRRDSAGAAADLGYPPLADPGGTEGRQRQPQHGRALRG